LNQNSDFNLSFSYFNQVLYMNSLNREDTGYLVAKERFVTNQIVMYFQRNHYLADIFSDRIGTYQEAGLIKKIITKYVYFEFIKHKSQAPKLSALSLKQLAAVFRVYLVGIVLSIMVFIYELCLINVKAKRDQRARNRLRVKQVKRSKKFLILL
jgi:hypothetical protein